MNPKSLQSARHRLRSVKSLTVLTGAGISAESGIPTFRDRGGIWEKFDPAQVATWEAFERDPKFVWEWYLLRMNVFQNARPNLAHEALALLEKRIPDFQLVTQNIDDLHRRAGSQKIVELHGNIWRTRCLGCGELKRLSKIPEEAPPHCSACGKLLRPDVVWFGEALDPVNVRKAELSCETEVFMIVGTSGEVWPAAGFAHTAKSFGATLIEVNTQVTELSSIADLSLLGKAGEILKNLI